MHELAIVEGIISGVRERVGEARVTRVLLEVGLLSGVVPDSLRFFFEACTQDTALQGAAVEIDEIPAEGRCRTCAARFAARDFLALCPCGSAEVELEGGQQLVVKAVEVI
jgi:hydrogenase nickel incorporation protein HypA/HybF